MSDKNEPKFVANDLHGRISRNPHFGRVLRERLEARHAKGTAIRRILDTLDDEQLVLRYLTHKRVAKAAKVSVLTQVELA